MRVKLWEWRGDRFVSIWVEGEPGAAVDQQAHGVFTSAGAALAHYGLALSDTVRTRIFARAAAARNVCSAARQRALTGQSRAAGSSYISPEHINSSADMALELIAMSPPAVGVRAVREHQPALNYIHHLKYGPWLFLPGMSSEDDSLERQCGDIFDRQARVLGECGYGWSDVARVSFFLHRLEDKDRFLSLISRPGMIPLERSELELVDGYSRPGKLIEIELTAWRS